MAPGSTASDYAENLAGTETTIEVWCTEDEVEDIGDLVTLEEAGENTPPRGWPGAVNKERRRRLFFDNYTGAHAMIRIILPQTEEKNEKIGRKSRLCR